jgi:hypothetical protein
MNAQDFDAVVERRLELIKAILLKKRAEYAPEGGDRLHNFNRAAAMLQCSPESALIGMWTKHIVSLLDICDKVEHETPSIELIEEKVGDAVNYLVLLEAMLKDRHKKRTEPS